MSLTIKNISTIILLFISITSQAEDWPMYMRDANRSGNTSFKIGSKLYLQWEYSPRNLPAPAWPAPAKTDYWHREADLKPRVIYDKANQTVTLGENIYFGSSADDKVYCLDTKTGKEKWTFFTGGPVRLAPSVYKGLIYFGSDDGCVYCLDAESGILKWKKDPTEKRLIPGNERMISVSPVRTGILIYNGIAYFSAGIFPREGVTIYAVDALSGKVIWQNNNSGISPQSYMLATESELFIPTGRTTPVVFNRITGEKKGNFEGNGGAYAILADNALVYGAGDLGTLEYSRDVKNKIATFNGEQMLVSGNISFLRTENEITAISRSEYIDNYNDWAKVSETRSELANNVWDLREQRKVALSVNKDVSAIDKKIEKLLSKIENTDTKQKSIEKGGTIWKKQVKEIYSMVIAGNSLITGGNGKVTIVDSKNGDLKWESNVKGNVYGLSVSNGNLYASTDNGNIYCFNSNTNATVNKVSSIKSDPFSENKNANQFKDISNNIVKNTGVTKGYCLVIGAGEGQLISELAKSTDLQIVGIVNNESKLKIARTNLDKAGLYGSRVTLHLNSGSSLQHTKNFANLVIFGDEYLSDTPNISAEEILRMVKPFGGIAYLGGNSMDLPLLQNWVNKSSKTDWVISRENGAWASLTKGSEPGFGEWTHQYADAGNSSSSMDQLQGEMQIQWFGRPGPRKMINRHSRSVSPLVKDGRLFVPADNRIITVDAYNGTILWEKEVPGSRVLGALKDFGNRVVTDDIMYIAANNECIGFDVENGDEKVRFDAPQPFPLNKHDWGYLSTVGKQLFGTGKKQGSTFTILGRINCDDFEGDFREMVTADYLF
ncbi:MAG: PQQ-binding-like beta-propeller repeat protein, partial [Bacteroidetes bacterium]|nr:PQQ-binding-like beta-propeller repeat protein [Bacteroidota bacterium]